MFEPCLHFFVSKILLMLTVFSSSMHLYQQKAFTKSYPRAPVILIPGIAGNQLKIKYDFPSVPYYLCAKKSDWYTIWINFRDIINTRCFAYHLGMIYDKTLNRMVDKPGTKVKAPDMGSTKEMAYLPVSLKFLASYFANIIDTLTNNGYKEGVDIFGAGYDFRIIVYKDQMELYFDELTTFIEKIYLKLQRRVVLITHSMGSPLVKRFLSMKSHLWKDVHIEHWFSINGVFAGSLNAILTATEGYSFGFPEFFARHELLKELESAQPSVYYLFPSVKFFNTSKIVFTSPTRNFTLGDVESLLNLTTPSYGKILYKQREEIWSNDDNLGVNFHCFYTTGIKTIDYIVANNDFKFIPDKSYNGFGDGTVIEQSLASCKQFINDGYKSTLEVHLNLEHVQVLRSSVMSQSITKFIRNL